MISSMVHADCMIMMYNAKVRKTGSKLDFSHRKMITRRRREKCFFRDPTRDFVNMCNYCSVYVETYGHTKVNFMTQTIGNWYLIAGLDKNIQVDKKWEWPKCIRPVERYKCTRNESDRNVYGLLRVIWLSPCTCSFTLKYSNPLLSLPFFFL